MLFTFCALFSNSFYFNKEVDTFIVTHVICRVDECMRIIILKSYKKMSYDSTLSYNFVDIHVFNT